MRAVSAAYDELGERRLSMFHHWLKVFPSHMALIFDAVLLSNRL